MRDLLDGESAQAAELRRLLRSVTETDEFLLGRHVRRLEEEFASRSHAPAAVACAGLFSGLVLLLRALEIGAGDDVLLATPVSRICRDAVRFVGASALERRADDRPRAVVVSDPWGVGGGPEIETYQEQGVVVIRVGRLVDGLAPIEPGTLVLATTDCDDLGALGECGMLLLPEPLAQRVALLRNHGRPGGFGQYLHKAVGFNSRMDEIVAAHLNARLAAGAASAARREVISRHFDEVLGDLATRVGDRDRTCSPYVVQCRDRAAVMTLLREHEIASRLPQYVYDATRAEATGDALIESTWWDQWLELPMAVAAEGVAT